MTTIAEMMRRVERLNMTELVIEGMEQHPDELADMNRKQMDEGVLKTGAPITPEYTPLWVYLR